MRLCWLMLLASAAAIMAERPTVGVRVAWPILPSLSSEFYPPNAYESAGRRATFGVSLHVPLSRILAVRAAPSWQRVSFDFTSIDPISDYTLTTTGNRWEVPVVLEFRLAEHVRPGIGAAWSLVSGERTTSTLVVRPGFGTETGYTNTGRVEALPAKAWPDSLPISSSRSAPAGSPSHLTYAIPAGCPSTSVAAATWTRSQQDCRCASEVPVYAALTQLFTTRRV